MPKQKKLPGNFRYGNEMQPTAGRLEGKVKIGDTMVGTYGGCLRSFTVIQCHFNKKGNDGVVIKLQSGLDNTDPVLLELEWTTNRNPAVGTWKHRSKEPLITDIRVGSVFGR